MTLPAAPPPEMPELLPCPFDAGQPVYDHYGTCASLKCPECDCGPDIQISDVMTIEERLAMTFSTDAPNFGYPASIIERLNNELFRRWNTRTATPKPYTERERMLAEALAAYDDRGRNTVIRREHGAAIALAAEIVAA